MQKRFLVTGNGVAKGTISPSKRSQDALGVRSTKRLHGGKVMILQKQLFKTVHKRRNAKHEVIANQQDSLYVHAIALPQGFMKLRGCIFTVMV